MTSNHGLNDATSAKANRKRHIRKRVSVEERREFMPGMETWPTVWCREPKHCNKWRIYDRHAVMTTN